MRLRRRVRLCSRWRIAGTSRRSFRRWYRLCLLQSLNWQQLLQRGLHYGRARASIRVSHNAGAPEVRNALRAIFWHPVFQQRASTSVVALLANLCVCGRIEHGPLQRVNTSNLPLFVGRVEHVNWADLHGVARGCAPEGLHRFVLTGLLATDHLVHEHAEAVPRSSMRSVHACRDATACKTHACHLNTRSLELAPDMSKLARCEGAPEDVYCSGQLLAFSAAHLRRHICKRACNSQAPSPL